MKKINIIFFTVTFSICLILAFYTDHRWEDWFITFRVAKNFAMGKGLVYNPGQSLMTYTSPLGVLIPAFLKLLFLNQSDDTVMWVYRIICSALLSFVPIFIFKILQSLKVDLKIILFSLLFFVSNFLIIDNSINGMESSFMVFFISYLIFILITHPRKVFLNLTLCFAGLMYSRPDGFIYGGAILGSFLIFNINSLGSSRIEFIKLLIKPILASAVLFLPWFIWTWIYYGTPIPHTIIAKSMIFDLLTLIKSIEYTLLTFRGAEYIFMPPCAGFGEWSIFPYIAQGISILTSLYWINFKGNVFARSISFATFLMLLYLNAISGQGPMPWYLPSVLLPSIIVLGLIFQDIINLIQYKSIPLKKLIKYIVYACGIFILSFSIVILLYGSIQIKYQQQIIETGNRKEIGLWLKKNKGENDNVFMECLGYIGFYSEMKTLDFPGISSPEVVAARRFLKTNKFSALIDYLKPDWLVLRRAEVDSINNDNPNLLTDNYSLKKVFDKEEAAILSPVVFGKNYLFTDAIFFVYKHKGVNETARRMQQGV